MKNERSWSSTLVIAIAAVVFGTAGFVLSQIAPQQLGMVCSAVMFLILVAMTLTFGALKSIARVDK